MPDKHALLSASSAHIWTMCTRAPRLWENIPNVGSKYTEEGTRAHSLCELKLEALLKGGTVQRALVVCDDDEMWNCSDQYRDFVEEEFNEAKANTPDAKLFIEKELDFGEYVPEGFGTSDAVIVSDTTLEVIDFKYGKGVQVEAEDNPQFRLYALGAYIALGDIYEFKTIKTVAFQPRIDHITSETIPVSELLAWAEDFIKPRAELAFKGEGEFCVGEHCRFCKAGGKCRARAEVAFDVIDASSTAPDLLDDGEIASILDKLDDTEKWIKAVREYAENKAISEGHKWPGYKLVESRTQKKILQQVEALDALEAAGYQRDEVTNLKLKGLTDLKKILGKADYEKIIVPFEVKPKGEPTLVKETDKRPEINPVDEMFKEEL